MNEQAARLLSCNVGRPVRVSTGRGDVLTGIYKKPVEGKLPLRRLNLEGDQQADLTVHGGFEKAVYAYPSEHYEYWRSELPDHEMPPGMFGENFTTEGLSESTVAIGDQFRIGSALVQVSQPRMPCFKLALKFGLSDMVKRFWASGRSGFYLSVLQEGEVEAGDMLFRTAGSEPRVTVQEVLHLYRSSAPSRASLERALATPLAGSWKKELRERLVSHAR